MIGRAGRREDGDAVLMLDLDLQHRGAVVPMEHISAFRLHMQRVMAMRERELAAQSTLSSSCEPTYEQQHGSCDSSSTTTMRLLPLKAGGASSKGMDEVLYRKLTKLSDVVAGLLNADIRPFSSCLLENEADLQRLILEVGSVRTRTLF